MPSPGGKLEVLFGDAERQLAVAASHAVGHEVAISATAHEQHPARRLGGGAAGERLVARQNGQRVFRQRQPRSDSAASDSGAARAA